MIDDYTQTDSEAAAWREIARRLDEAHAYCHAHNLRIGQNVWHAILDDAIRLRAAQPVVSLCTCTVTSRGHVAPNRNCVVHGSGGIIERYAIPPSARNDR